MGFLNALELYSARAFSYPFETSQLCWNGPRAPHTHTSRTHGRFPRTLQILPWVSRRGQRRRYASAGPVAIKTLHGFGTPGVLFFGAVYDCTQQTHKFGAKTFVTMVQSYRVFVRFYGSTPQEDELSYSATAGPVPACHWQKESCFFFGPELRAIVVPAAVPLTARNKTKRALVMFASSSCLWSRENNTKRELLRNSHARTPLQELALSAGALRQSLVATCGALAENLFNRKSWTKHTMLALDESFHRLRCAAAADVSS